MLAIEVSNLKKTYDGVEVVKSISFNVEKGYVFGFLGPNGAGKTTTLEMIEGLRSPESGEISILGMDPKKKIKEIQSIIGVQLQSAVLDQRIRVHEALELFASYYPKSMDLEELLELVKLKEKRNTFQKDLSGGQFQRLAMALCLVNDPEILFLDEPTTGLDPQSRRNLWDIVLELKKRGKTIVITTHYMDEAEKLCDRIAIIDNGEIISEGSPQELIEKLDAGRIVEIPVDNFIDKVKLNSITRSEVHGGVTELYTNNLGQTLEELLNNKESFDLETVHIRKATLEDVFIHLTGRSLRE